MKRILVSGGAGQIGSELVPALRERYGADNVICGDIKKPQGSLAEDGPFVQLDCLDKEKVIDTIKKFNVGTIYHLPALLSATAERNPQKAWNINMNGLLIALEVAREFKCSIFVPSSIAAFGPSTPRVKTPQDTIQRPQTIYGITKVAGELLCDYYFMKWGVDARGVRYPGIISYKTPPGGGTTDYAVDIFYGAIKEKRYECFLREDTRLDMMYMPDAVKAAISLMDADPSKLIHRNAFNITAMSFTPHELAQEIKKHIPDFVISYSVDPLRQSIADTWPDSLDDTCAREEWGWCPDYDISTMTQDMLVNLKKKLLK